MTARVDLNRDDGAVIYLNGTELFRTNMPGGPITYSTFANDAADGFVDFEIPVSSLQSGVNHLAAEVHQSSGSSSDLAFDLGVQLLVEQPYDNALFSVSGNSLVLAETLTAESTNGAESLKTQLRVTDSLGRSLTRLFTIPILDSPPVASDLILEGSPLVGMELQASFEFSDLENDDESTHEYRWFRADNIAGDAAVVIPGASGSEYVIQAADLGAFIGFDVVPVSNGRESHGDAVRSEFVGSVYKAIVSLSLAGNSAIVEDGDARAEIIVHRVGALGDPLEVGLRFTGDGGFETPGADSLGIVVIPAGQESTSVFLSPIDDNLVESSQAFSVTIVEPDECYLVDQDSREISGEILDDDFAPTADPDHFELVEDGLLQVDRETGLLTNDSDIDDGTDSLVAELLTPPSHGELILNPDGSFTYTPSPDFFGMDSFTYAASDGTNRSGAGEVTIEVNELVDLSLTAEESRDPVLAGHPTAASVDHTILITNAGPSQATGVVIKVDSITPAGVTTTVSVGSLTENLWSVPELADGATASLTLSYAAGAAASGEVDAIRTSAEVTAVEQPTASDEVVIATISTSILSAASTAVDPVDEKPILDRQSGYLVQRVRVTNENPMALSGFLVAISGLPDDVTVVDPAYTDSTGVPFVHHPGSLAPGASVLLTVEFYRGNRDANFTPAYSVQLLAPGEQLPNALQIAGTVITRIVVLSEGLVLIEWPCLPGEKFAIEYSSDMISWQLAGDGPITALGTQLQWLDSGPPKTDSHPEDQKKRYYRAVPIKTVEE